MTPIDDYIKLAITDRQQHLILSDPCIERGGSTKGGLSSYCKGLKAHILDTSIPSGMKIHICHACNNALCSNPKHLYWGTARENDNDTIVNDGISIWEKMVAKYGYDEACKMNAKGKKGNTKEEKTKNLISESLTSYNRLMANSSTPHFNIGKKRKIVKCPYCTKEGSESLMHRWHFSNCKIKGDMA